MVYFCHFKNATPVYQNKNGKIPRDTFPLIAATMIPACKSDTDDSPFLHVPSIPWGAGVGTFVIAVVGAVVRKAVNNK